MNRKRTHGGDDGLRTKGIGGRTGGVGGLHKSHAERDMLIRQNTFEYI